ncbi:MAG TPA: tail fiber domain-containing protein [Patescibacteria group bacterium]|jgi:hypothetical protein|nr:tail fiber domain-containing protein [Patescibacteria group bacterium]
MPEITINLIHDLRKSHALKKPKPPFFGGLRTGYVRAWVFVVLKVWLIVALINGVTTMDKIERNMALLDSYIRNDFSQPEIFFPNQPQTTLAIGKFHKPKSSNSLQTNSGVFMPRGPELATDNNEEGTVAGDFTASSSSTQSIVSSASSASLVSVPPSPAQATSGNSSAAALTNVTEQFVQQTVQYSLAQSINFGFILGNGTALRGCLFADQYGIISGSGRRCTTGGGGSSSSGGGTVSMAIGDAVTGATQGSVLFAGASGALAQDNTNFFFDDSTNSLSLGGNLTVAGLGGSGIRCLQTDNTGAISVAGASCGSGGSQTPWTAPIDADGFAVTNSTGFNGLVVTPNSGVITTGTWNGTTIAVANGGTGGTSFTSNGVVYGNGSSPLQVTAQGGANTVLVANNGAPSFSSSITVGTSVTSPTVNATTAVQINGANINTAGTLNNVAYLNQANNFVASSTVGISYTNSSGHALMKVDAASASQGGYYIYKAGVEKAQLAVLGSSNDLTFNMAGTPHMTLQAAGNLGIGDASPAAMLTVGNGDLFQVNSSGAIAAATGITSSGTITLSGLGGGGVQCVQTSNTGVLSAAACGGSGGITIGTTAITSGTNGRVLYDNSGVVGEMTTTGSGTVLALATSPAFSTSISTPSIVTASGALTVTPAAGSNLNINLSTTGDFAVNTNQLYVDTSTGNVGIGTASPSSLLTVVGTGASDSAITIGPTTASDGNATLYLNGKNGGTTYQASIYSSYLGALLIAPNAADPSVIIGGADYVNGNMLNVFGRAAIGSTYAASAAPTDGMIIEGNVGIGDATPVAMFTVGAGDLFQVNSSGAIAATTGITTTGALNTYVGGGADIFNAFDTSDSNNPVATMYIGSDSGIMELGGGGTLDQIHLSGAGGGSSYFRNSLGIGTDTPGYLLHVAENTSNGSSSITANMTPTYDYSSNGSHPQTVLWAQPVITGSANNTGTIRAFNALADDNTNTGVLTKVIGAELATENNDAGTIINAYGSYNRVDKNYTGPITTAYGTYSAVNNNNATNAITTAYGLYSGVNNSGTIDTGYGLYINDIQATTGYGVYQSGSSNNNYFAGAVGIGTATPDYMLDVAGDMGIGDGSSPGTIYDNSGSTDRIEFSNTGAAVSVISAGSTFFTANGTGGVMDFNPNQENIDWRVRSNATTYSLTVNGLTGHVGIGTNSASEQLTVGGNITTETSDYGNGAAGPIIILGRNNNGTTGAGSVNFQSKAGTAGYVWQDNAGNLRINTSAPTNALDTAGVVVGTQTSTRNTKQDITDYTDYAAALNMVTSAPLHTFRYIKDVHGYGANSPLAKPHIGYIADEVPADFMWGNSIDQVSVNGILMASIKALNAKITDLQTASANPNLFASDTPIILQSQLYLSGDNVGEAKILAGQKSVHVSFVKNYQYQPIVTTTPEGRVGSEYWVSDKDESGFTIYIDQEASDDIVFDWHSFAGQSAKLTVSDGSTSNIELVVASAPVAPPAGTPPSEPTPPEPADSGTVAGDTTPPDSGTDGGVITPRGDALPADSQPTE